MKIVKTGLLVFLVIIVIGAIVGALLLHRGFRANQNPLPLEASVARALRNLAIPSGERSQKNPLGSNTDTVEQGRTYYMHRCANCHGEDGSAQTVVGANLYPKAPDLRSDASQNLTDGEIHYIIENGVQLTGMPAVHGESTGDSWKLVSFIRSFRSSPPPTQSLHTAHYAGSQACATCHSEIYERWKKTPMANVVRDPHEHPEAIIPDLATNKVAKFSKDQIAFVYGSLWKQRYFTKVGDDYFPLSAQWVVGTREWRPYKVPATGADWWTQYYPDDNMQRPTGPTCDGCHSVGYDIHTKQVAEWNVGCERCHGPGSEHVAHPTRENIVNPAQMDSVAATDTCIQCHSQGRPVTVPLEGKYYDWPVGYNVGLRLADFWKLEDCTLGQTSFLYFPDCTAHKNRMQGNDFVQSLMYRRGVTCASCHDVHGTSNSAQLRKPAAQLCLDCHGPSSANGPHTATLEEHTHHKTGSAGSQCIACHMPKIESEGVPGAFVHAHTFRFISPAETDKYKIPNPCTSCHQDKPAGWAADAMNHWQEHSPWTPML
jgi:predicted CXXCH cytochrome family protein